MSDLKGDRLRRGSSGAIVTADTETHALLRDLALGARRAEVG